MLNLPKQYQSDFINPKVKPTGPVDIDWSNPITKGLMFYGIVIGGTFVNLASQNNTSSYAGTLPDVQIKKGGSSYGQNIKTGTSSSQKFTPNMTMGTGNKITFAGRAIMDAKGVASSYLLAGDSFQWILFYVVSNDKFQCNFNGALNTGQSTSTHTVGEWLDVMAVHRGGAFNSNGSFFIDGVKEGVTGGDGSSSNDSNISTDLMIGDNISGVRPLDGNVDYIAIWNRDLLDVEAVEFQRSPYGVLKPSNASLYYKSSGAPPTGFESQWAIHANKLINMAQ